MRPLVLAVVLFFALSTCRSKTDVVPGTIWSSGCIELRPDQNVYRLDGMCCAYVLMVPIDLTTSRTFAVSGSYHVFTGAGFANTAITIFGQLAPDQKSLYLSYTLPGQSVAQRWLLEPGPAKLACQCGCD